VRSRRLRVLPGAWSLEPEADTDSETA